MNKILRDDVASFDGKFSTPPDFNVGGTGRVPEAAIAQYERDGVVCLRQVLKADAIAELRADMDVAVADPKPIFVKVGGGPDDPRFFYFEYQMHKRFESFRRLVWDSVVPNLAMALMRSPMLGLYYINSFVKEGGAVNKPTPWHQDGSYSRMLGEKVINFYIALDPMPAEATLRFKQGSHLPGITYLPVGGEWEGPSTNPVARGKVPMPAFAEIDGASPTIA